MRKIALTGAVLAAMCSTGCALTRPHVSPVDIADKRPAIRAAVDPDPHASIGLQYAKRVQAEYHDRREAILDTQAGALIGLIPLAGYVGYEAARGGAGAHVAALAGAGLAGLSLTQVLVQASRIKVYTQAHNAVGCGIGVYRLAAAQQGFAPEVESRWRDDVAAARTKLEHVQDDLRGAASRIDAGLAQMPRADELGLHLHLAQVEHDRAKEAYVTAAAAAVPAKPGDGTPAAGGVPRSGPVASDEHARKALKHADEDVRAAADALRRRAGLERGKLRIGSYLVSASSLDAAAVRVNALLDVAPSSVLDAELINHVERVMRDADAELDNTIPPMSAAAPFAAVLQNQPVPARVSTATGVPDDGAPGVRIALVAKYGADIERARETLEDVSRTLTRVQEEILAALAVRAAQGGARTLDLASCRYVATNATYQAPPVALQLGVGDADHRSAKTVGIGKSITVTLIGGQLEHGVFITAPAAQAIIIAKTQSGDMSSFTFTVPPVPDGGAAPVPAGTTTDVIFRDRAGATRQMTLTVVP